MSSEPALGIGELVMIGGKSQGVWEIVGIRHQIARVAARSIDLERGWVRSLPLEQLARYDRDRVEHDDA